MSMNHQATMPILHRLDKKMDSVNDDIDDFMQAQAAGEAPDPAEFTRLIEKRMTTQQAIQAQFKLNEKPMKTVLNETR